MQDIKNKVVWITGASSGIGEAMVHAFAKEGAKIVLSARRVEELLRVAKEASLKPEDHLILHLDLTEYNDFSAQVRQVLDKFGRIDILVNNGGISQRALAKDTSINVDKQIMEVNFYGTVALTKAVLPHMLSAKNGLIVVISSVLGKMGTPWRSGYSASKHALHGFFDTLRAECYDDGLRVLLVCPGFTHTNITVNALTGIGTKLGQMDPAIASGLSPAEVARQIVSAVKSGKEEVIISRFKEKFGVWAKRHFPSLFSVMIRRMNTR